MLRTRFLLLTQGFNLRGELCHAALLHYSSFTQSLVLYTALTLYHNITLANSYPILAHASHLHTITCTHGLQSMSTTQSICLGGSQHSTAYVATSTCDRNVLDSQHRRSRVGMPTRGRVTQSLQLGGFPHSARSPPVGLKRWMAKWFGHGSPMVCDPDDSQVPPSVGCW